MSDNKETGDKSTTGADAKDCRLRELSELFNMRPLDSLMNEPMANVVHHCQYVFWLMYHAMVFTNSQLEDVRSSPMWTNRPFRAHTGGQLSRMETVVAMNYLLSGNMRAWLWCKQKLGMNDDPSVDKPLNVTVEEVGRALAMVSAYRSPSWIAVATSIKQWLETGDRVPIDEYRFHLAEVRYDDAMLAPVMVYSPYQIDPESAKEQDADRPPVCSPKRGVKRDSAALGERDSAAVGDSPSSDAVTVAEVRQVKRAAKRPRFFTTFSLTVREIPPPETAPEAAGPSEEPACAGPSEEPVTAGSD